MTAATETDKLSKALIHVYYKHNRVLDLLKYRTTQEIYHAGSIHKQHQRISLLYKNQKILCSEQTALHLKCLPYTVELLA